METILIVKTGALGDILHTLPSLHLLRSRFPEGRILWLVETRYGAVLEDHPLIDRLIRIDTVAFRKNLFSAKTWKKIRGEIRSIRSEKTALAFDFQGLVKSGLMVVLSGAPVRVGFPWGAARERLNRIFLNRTYRASGSGSHVIEQNLSLVRGHLGISEEAGIAFPLPDRFCRKAEEFFPADVLAGIPEKGFAVLNPGGGWPSKLWPVEGYSALARRILGETDLSLFIAYGPGEEGLAQGVLPQAGGGRVLSFPTNLPELAALLRRAKILVGGDTGPLHLAVAVGTPVVGVFGPTDPARNGSINPADIHVTRNLDCAPCHKRRCRNDECMKEIEVAEVFDAFQKRLKRIHEA